MKSSVKIAQDAKKIAKTIIQKEKEQAKAKKPYHPPPNSLLSAATVIVKTPFGDKQIFNRQKKEIALRQRVAGGSAVLKAKTKGK